MMLHLDIVDAIRLAVVVLITMTVKAVFVFKEALENGVVLQVVLLMVQRAKIVANVVLVQHAWILTLTLVPYVHHVVVRVTHVVVAVIVVAMFAILQVALQLVPALVIPMVVLVLMDQHVKQVFAHTGHVIVQVMVLLVQQMKTVAVMSAQVANVVNK